MPYAEPDPGPRREVRRPETDDPRKKTVFAGVLIAYRIREPEWALTHWCEPSSRTWRLIAEGKKRYDREQARRQMIDRFRDKTWFGVPILDQFDLRCLDEPIWEQ